ncbi:DMT family transporter [Thiothrix unzii]|jgi:drug/metabolite transporter (DMT)-like permease|uniref:DMT family transporter n=1 Tax=Thiothrix unzii TaxID=111769 RepID=UPI002A363A17|nr:DMT family transporter [Thiothrix unzii]MDX9990130.1 DMT family transporter [Thiothrix unzii]
MQHSFLNRFSPYLLLVLTILFWAGNFNLARAIHADVPPLGLSFWRWAVAALILLPFAWGSMRAALPLAREHWRLVLALAVLGIAGFNSLVYLGLQTTTATNGVLLQSVTPITMILLAGLVLHEKSTLAQWAGIGVSLVGVLVIITKADWQVLQQLAFNRGDMWIVLATLDWSLYTVLLRKLPQGLRGMPILGFSITLGALAILPLYVYESVTFQTMPVTAVSVASIAYVAVFPSLLSYMFWNHATQKLGVNRTGQFSHLMPVFGILLATLLLGERLQFYHALGMLLVAAGLVLTNKFKEGKP